MGRHDLVDDPRFMDVADRLANFDALADIIRDFAAQVPDPDTFESIFAEHQLAVGQVRQPGELTETEWAAERGVVVDVDDRAGGSIRVPNVPWRFSDAPDVAVSGTRSIAARTTAPCSPTSSATTMPSSTTSSRAASCRPASPARTS